MENCGHCGYPGQLESMGEDVKAEGWTDHVEGYGDFELATVWRLYRCPRCGEPTLGRYLWTEFFDPDDVELIRVYPKPYSGEALPSNVAKAYQLALRGRATDPAFYAVGVRRTLEAICDYEGIPGTSQKGGFIPIEQRLKSLKDSDRLPTDLSTFDPQS